MAVEINLTHEQAQQLRDTAPAHSDLQAVLDLARDAGLDVSDHQATLDKAVQMREGMLRNFPPKLPGAAT